MSWIKMRSDLARDPSVVSVALRLKVSVHNVVGRLHALWALADEQTEDGRLDGMTGEWLDGYLEQEGFSAALQEAGWLSLTPRGIEVPDFDKHNSASAKRRAEDARRKGRVRKVSAKCPQPTGQIAELEKSKSREEKRQSQNPPNPPKGGRVARFDLPQDWKDDEELRLALSDWRQMRQRQKAPLTQLAADRAIKRLDKLSAGDATTARHIVEQSVDSGWKGFFPLHEESANGNGRAPKSKHDWIKNVGPLERDC